MGNRDIKMKFYITTAIPYVNAPPHIGHALEFVQTDTIARYHRLRGDKTYLATGADENALKNVQAAEKEGLSPQELVDKNAGLFQIFAQRLNVQVDGFDRGSNQKTHWPGAIELWKRCERAGDIYKKNYRGLYCVGHEAFLTEKELVDGKCPDHDIEPEVVEEENYFFRLSKYQSGLERVISSDEYRIVPESRKKEVLNFIKGGLEDFSISRSRERARGWGIPVPGDDSQVIYVWFDALAIYLTVAGFGIDEKKFNQWWPADLHVIGKDIIRFHAVYWPAMLLSAGIDLPKKLLVHGFITSDRQKISKTVGNVIDPSEYIEEFGVDALRYYLLAEVPTTEDSDFSRERFIERYNGDLANGLGNLTARILALTAGREELPTEDIDYRIYDEIEVTWKGYETAIEDFNLRRAAEIIWNLVHRLDEYIEEVKPWEQKTIQISHTLLTGLANVAWLIRPFLPQTSDKTFAGLGTTPDATEWKFKPRKIGALFPKIDD